MEQLNQTTQQNASAPEELTATAEEMSSQSEQLQQLMSFFRIESAAVANTALRPVVGRKVGDKLVGLVQQAAESVPTEAGYVRC